MNEVLVLWIIIAAICGFVGGFLLERSDRWGTGFFLGLLLGPIGIVVAAIMRLDRTGEAPVATTAPTRKCPDCAEVVLAEARKCRFCGAALEPIAPPPPVTAPPDETTSPRARRIKGAIAVSLILGAILLTIVSAWLGDKK